MAKAEITMPNGTKITVDGTPEEIIKIQEAFASGPSKGKRSRSKRKIKAGESKKKPAKDGPLKRIRELIENDFFKQKRTIEDVRKTLEERAIFYKTPDLSPSLVRLVKKGELRRLKEEGQWRYVNT